MCDSKTREVARLEQKVRKLTKELEKVTRKASLTGANMLKQQSAAQADRLFEIIRIFEVASGQKLNPSKSTGILFGKEKQADTPTGTGIKWVRFGEAMVEEGRMAQKRSIFQEVETDGPARVAPKGGMIDARPKGARRAVLCI